MSWAETIISSPFLNPEAKQDKCKPAVQLDTEIACLASVNLEILSQKGRVFSMYNHYLKYFH